MVSAQVYYAAEKTQNYFPVCKIVFVKACLCLDWSPVSHFIHTPQKTFDDAPAPSKICKHLKSTVR